MTPTIPVRVDGTPTAAWLRDTLDDGMIGGDARVISYGPPAVLVTAPDGTRLRITVEDPHH